MAWWRWRAGQTLPPRGALCLATWARGCQVGYWRMAGVSVNRWTRYGKDRLYVMDGAVRLGWYDLVDRRVSMWRTPRGKRRSVPPSRGMTRLLGAPG